ERRVHRQATDAGVRAQDAVRADAAAAHQHRAAQKPGAGTDADPGFDDDQRTDLDILAQFRTGVDDGTRMHPDCAQAQVLGYMKLRVASAAVSSPTRALARTLHRPRRLRSISPVRRSWSPGTTLRRKRASSMPVR